MNAKIYSNCKTWCIRIYSSHVNEFADLRIYFKWLKKYKWSLDLFTFYLLKLIWLYKLIKYCLYGYLEFHTYLSNLLKVCQISLAFFTIFLYGRWYLKIAMDGSKGQLISKTIFKKFIKYGSDILLIINSWISEWQESRLIFSSNL